MPSSSSTVLTDQLSATQPTPAAQPAATTQPPDALCECQDCQSEEHDTDNDQCGNDAEYLLEYTGFSCGGCLPMMASLAVAQAEDAVDFGDEPPYAKITEYHAGAPLFPNPAA